MGLLENGSLQDSRWELNRASKRGVFQVRAYKPVYLAPLSWASNRNTMPRTPNPETSVTEPQDLDSVEAKFQISMKFKLAESLFGEGVDLWGAYTQVSRWQVYNSENSRPFRETNYEPELMLVVPHRLQHSGMAGAHGRRRPEPPVQRPRRCRCPGAGTGSFSSSGSTATTGR